ncbi:MAG: hypothetical protein KDC05_10190 [Bacteroidales bacterium]|nr:hypothetical protein [Bacteroidales bacterium]
MNIELIAPLSQAWKRMKTALFQPFDITKWFMVGFTAFLAGLLDYKGGGRGENSSEYGINEGLYEFFTFPETVRQWLVDHPLVSSLIVVGIIFAIAVIIVLLWLSSRGKFMFLYNVVHDKAEVSFPWREYAREANSLFLWRLGFTVISLLVFGLTFYYAFNHFREAYFDNEPFVSQIPSLIGIGLLFIVVTILISLISLYLDSFVVPVMFKHRISASQAWNKFLIIFWPKLGYFILYALFILILLILVGILVVVFGFMTCCIGFLLLIIPYIGSVILLPVTYTFRAYSIEFLAQFGEEFDILETASGEENIGE